MGKFSRDKGRRGEYSLRDLIRLHGYNADRVPLSGASQGFKGDIKIEKDGKIWFAELKTRKASFGSIYDLFLAHQLRTKNDTICVVYDGHLIKITTSLISILEEGGTYLFPNREEVLDSNPRTLKKILNLKKVVGSCDFLAIKDDFRPFIFIRYRT